MYALSLSLSLSLTPLLSNSLPPSSDLSLLYLSLHLSLSSCFSVYLFLLYISLFPTACCLYPPLSLSIYSLYLSISSSFLSLPVYIISLHSPSIHISIFLPVYIYPPFIYFLSLLSLLAYIFLSLSLNMYVCVYICVCMYVYICMYPTFLYLSLSRPPSLPPSTTNRHERVPSMWPNALNIFFQGTFGSALPFRSVLSLHVVSSTNIWPTHAMHRLVDFRSTVFGRLELVDKNDAVVAVSAKCLSAKCLLAKCRSVKCFSIKSHGL